MVSPAVQRIAQLNDQFRRADPGISGKTVLVAEFDDFTEDNDPHEEHDCCVFQLGRAKCFWKIDAYDPPLFNGIGLCH